MTSSELRIGMVSVDAPPHLGGIGRHVGSLLQGLRSSGITVELYDRSACPLRFRLGKNVGFSIGLADRLRPWILANGINLLHVHAGPGGVFLPFPPVPMIVTANHTYAQQARLPGQGWKTFFKSSEWSTYLSAVSVACISADTASSLRDDYHISPDRIRTIPCGFDLAPWIASDADPAVRRGCLFVGRTDSRKGFDLLCAAWTKIRAAHPDATLTVAGAVGQDANGIRFLGRVSDAELTALVGQSRILVAPSRLEGFGLAAAEAVAAGTPVIATDVSGLRSVVRHGTTGLLTAVNADAIAEALSLLLSDDVLWNRLHQGCLTERTVFSLEREVAAYLALYDEVYSRVTCATR